MPYVRLFIIPDPRSNSYSTLRLLSVAIGSGISSDCYMEYASISSAQPEVVPTLPTIVL